jgi:hypothetical protein
MLGKRLLCASLLGIGLLMLGVGYATVNCVGGISPNCVGPSSYTCTVPGAPIGGAVSCSPTCTASGQTAVPPFFSVSATGVCGGPPIIGLPNCPPLFTSQLSVNGAMHTTTYTVTASYQASLGPLCMEVSSYSESSTCGMNCTCQ